MTLHGQINGFGGLGAKKCCLGAIAEQSLRLSGSLLLKCFGYFFPFSGEKARYFPSGVGGYQKRVNIELTFVRWPEMRLKNNANVTQLLRFTSCSAASRWPKKSMNALKSISALTQRIEHDFIF